MGRASWRRRQARDGEQWWGGGPDLGEGVSAVVPLGVKTKSYLELPLSLQPRPDMHQELHGLPLSG